MKITDLLSSYPLIIETQIAWGEMDAYQHVNNTVYFKYFESARIAYLERLGFDRLKEQTGIGPILASTGCRFRLPLTFPDTISTGARVINIAEDRFEMSYRVVSHRHRKVSAEGEGMLVSYDYRQQQKVPLPAQIRDAIEAFER